MHRTISNNFTTHTRYLFNGMETDDELKGGGNSYTTEFRQYDPRLGRWLSVDPLVSIEASWTPYRAFFDNPMIYTDNNGLFESRKKARQYKKEHDISGKISKNVDGEGYSINDKKNNTSYTKGSQWEIDNHYTNSEGISVSALVTPKNEEKTSSKNMFDNINNGIGFGLGVQSELMTYAVAQNYKTATNNYSYSKLTKSQQTWRATKTLGKTGTNLLKATKFIGAAGGVFSIYTKSVEISDKGIENMTVRDGADMTVALAGTAATVFMASNPIGWGIGLGCLIYSAGTMIYDASSEK